MLPADATASRRTTETQARRVAGFILSAARETTNGGDGAHIRRADYSSRRTKKALGPAGTMGAPAG